MLRARTWGVTCVSSTRSSKFELVTCSLLIVRDLFVAPMSTFLLTREAALTDVWNEEQIFERQTALSKLAVQTWALDS